MKIRCARPIPAALTALATLWALAAHAHGDEDHAATGQPGDPKQVGRTVAIAMSDRMRFEPASVPVRKGETIRFVLRNEGRLKHEMVLGTIAELKKHAALMRKFPEMEHADPNQASVEPGGTGELIWKFTKAGTVDFACLQAGHYEAGMRGKVVVALAGAAEPADLTEGEVRRVDKEARKITLKHGPIRSLDMPGMTMVFQVGDPAMLDAVKAGDHVRFSVERSGGAMVLTRIEPVR